MLRRQRTERGALQLASPEVRFEIDTETHDPLDVGMYQVRAAKAPPRSASLHGVFVVLEPGHVRRARAHRHPAPFVLMRCYACVSSACTLCMERDCGLVCWHHWPVVQECAVCQAWSMT